MDPQGLWQAAGATALLNAGFGAAGYATRRDLTAIARAGFWALLSLIAFGVVFTKLGITSRKNLHDTLPPRGGSTAPESQQDGRA